jgi:DNA-binding MarR family transcriptional regulator
MLSPGACSPLRPAAAWLPTSLLAGSYRVRVAARDAVDDQAALDWELIRRVVARADQRILSQVAGPELPEQSFGVLHALLHAPDKRLPMSHLARELLMTSGGFTKLADRLGRAGLIDRRGSEGVRRVVYASLTSEGVQVARDAERRYRAALREQLLQTLTPAQLGTVADGLRALDEHADVPHETTPARAGAASPPSTAGPARRRVART